VSEAAPNASSATARGVFVTGTDTAVGKTRVACALLRAYADSGQRVLGMKPVAAGAERWPAGFRNEDVEMLRAASSVSVPRELTNPYCFEPAIAPHLAASEAGVEIELTRIVDAYAHMCRLADRIVVEGAGGFLVPIGSGLSMADLARALGLPIVLVVGMRLGCLNHAMLTCESIERHGLRLAGWVANCVDPKMQRLDDNVFALCERITAPLLAVSGYDPAPGSAPLFDAAKLVDLHA